MNYLETITSRYAKRFYTSGKYYAMDYGVRFNPVADSKTGKIKYKASPGDKATPFWFVDHKANPNSYKNHLTQHDPKIDWGMIIPPCDLDGDSDRKGYSWWGAIDEDVYDQPDHIKRIVKQIYDEKLPLVPCYSKSGGLHLYMCCPVDKPVRGSKIVNALKHLKKKLNATAKEIYPKQTIPVWDIKKNRWSPGNGILVPYKSCIQIGADTTYIKPATSWIKNENLDTGTLEEFLDHCDTIEVDEEYLDKIPIDLEDKIKKEDATTAKSNEIPLSGLDDILDKIKKQIKHEKGGTFDNWIVQYVAVAIGRYNQSNEEILNQLETVKDINDKAADEDYFTDKIKNCRDKFDKKDPGPEKQQFMDNTFFLMDQEKYFDFRTGKSYGERAIETKFHKIFGGVTAPTYFKKHQTELNIAESSKYMPAKWSETSPIFKHIDNLQYLNSYRPGPLKPRTVQTEKDIELFLKLIEFMIPIEEYRSWVLDFMAGIVQHKGHKWRWVIFFYSFAKQVGKGSIFRVLELILGEDNVMETKVALMLDKGSMYTDKQIVLIDEVKSKGDWQERKQLANDLKMIITGKKVSARRMRVDYKQVENNANFMIFSNDKKAITLDDEDKRYLVLYHESARLDQNFYNEFHDWLEGPDKTKKDGANGGAELIYDYLLRREIKLDLTGTAPETIFQKEMESNNEDPLVQRLQQWLNEENGPFALELGDIRGTTELEQYIIKNCTGYVVKMATNPKTLKDSLIQVGAKFIGQVRHKIRQEKPTLFIIRNHKKYQEIKNIEICNEHWRPLLIEKQSERTQQIIDDHNVKEINKANTKKTYIHEYEKTGSDVGHENYYNDAGIE